MTAIEAPPRPHEITVRVLSQAFILSHGKRHPKDFDAAEGKALLSHLAVEGNMAASTQIPALSALLFLYRDGSGVELP